MDQRKRCKNCHRVLDRNPRVKKQDYCGRAACQRARKRHWQTQKMRNDPDYRKNKTAAQDKWLEVNPDYWRNYRQRNPKYRERNRLLQKARDAKRRSRRLAKMDALVDKNSIKPDSYYYVVPTVADLAKMDALTQKFILIPVACEDCAKSCKEGLNVQPDSNCLRCPKKQTNDDKKAALSGTHPH
jgi:hypothetical protein